MTRVRVAPLAAMVLVGGLVAVAAANCASPTQIIVDVRVDSSLCSRINTGIAVTAPGNVDKASLATYQSGCLSTQGDGQSTIGALTITPSGADDAEVGIRVVAAVGDPANPAIPANPDACGRTDIDGKASWASCILARRTARFTPGETVTITVRLTSDCVGQYCGDDRECNAGVCVRPEQVQDDGGTAILDAQVIDFDTGSDAYVDAGDDACSHYCVGPSTTCSGNTCVIDCTKGKCNQQNTRCGGDFDCQFQCGREAGALDGLCSDIACTTTGACNFDCTGPGSNHCRDISCSGKTCNIACSNTNSTCNNVFMDAGTNKITCETTENGLPTCKDVVCDGDCTRTCGAGGFGCAAGDVSMCRGTCVDFAAAAPDAGLGNP